MTGDIVLYKYLVTFLENITQAKGAGKAVDMIYLDFIKAFD
jgi:hypothetical protein